MDGQPIGRHNSYWRTGRTFEVDNEHGETLATGSESVAVDVASEYITTPACFRLSVRNVHRFQRRGISSYTAWRESLLLRCITQVLDPWVSGYLTYAIKIFLD